MLRYNKLHERSYVAGHEERPVSVLMYRVYSVSTDNTLTWIYGLHYIKNTVHD
jgi:hypothetical protein